MNTKNLIYASLIGGGIIALVSNIPILQLINCLLCAGVWGGAILAAYFYKRFDGSITVGQGAAVGALAGVWAGLIAFLLGLLKIAGATAFLTSLRGYLPPEAQDFLLPSTLGVISVISSIISWVVTILFGTVGGLIGGAAFHSSSAPTAVPSSMTPVPPPAVSVPTPVEPVPPPSPAPQAQIEEPVIEKVDEPAAEEEVPEAPPEEPAAEEPDADAPSS